MHGSHALDRHPRFAETAGAHMVSRVPTAAPSDVAGAVRDRLGGARFDLADAVYLLEADHRLVGVVPMRALFAASSAARLEELAISPAQAVLADTDQEHVASRAIAHGLSSMPVVDRAHRLLGVVPAQALLEILRHEHVEDLHRLAGIRHEASRARAAIEAPPIRRARDRLPWILVGLLGSIAATLVMAGFEATLQAQVAVAFFVPAIVYLSDAVGTQSETVAVRGLSLSHRPLAAILAGELRTGLLIGLVLGTVAFLGVWLWLGEPRLAAAVGIALCIASGVATTIGFVFPWLLARSGRDPAFGSGPLATVVQDVLSLLIYFATVRVLVA